MAQPYYNVGTAAAEAGSKNVIGTGTLWSMWARPGDQFIGLDGTTAIIAAIVDNTHLTLLREWPGTSGSGAYEILYTPDDPFTQQESRGILQSISSSALVALGSLSPAARKGVRFDGTAAASLFDLSDYMLTLLDDADAAAARATLGAVNKAGDSGIGTLSIGAAGTGKVQIQGGSTSQPGYISFHLSDNTRTGFIGWGSDAYNTLTGDNGWGWRTVGEFRISDNFTIDPGVTTNINSILTLRVGAASSQQVQAQLGWNTGGYRWAHVLESDAAYSIYSYDAISALIARTISISQSGNLSVYGALSKGSGTFLVDHPIDPADKDLAHGFIEGPRYDLIYRGTVRLVAGRATVDIDRDSNPAHPMTPGTFAALTINATVHALQNQDSFARLRPEPISGATFEIICEDDTSTDEVAWMVIAERNDAFVRSGLDPNTDSNGRFIPERDKPDHNEGEPA